MKKKLKLMIEELEELAKEFFWEKFHGSYGYEIIEE